MLSMDQILASNELTMATTAAFPAFAILGGVLYLLRHAIQSDSRSIRFQKRTQLLRVCLVQLERSLQDVMHFEFVAGRLVPFLSI